MKKCSMMLVLAGAAVLCGAIVLFILVGQGTKEHLERRLGLKFPSGTQLTVQDSHGGFFGDGVLRAIAVFPDRRGQKEFQSAVEKQWHRHPVPKELIEPIQTVWTAGGEQSEKIPCTDRGLWFYRDRFEEDTGKLYILECDY